MFQNPHIDPTSCKATTDRCRLRQLSILWVGFPAIAQAESPRGPCLGRVKSQRCRVYNRKTSEELIRASLGECEAVQPAKTPPAALVSRD